MKSTKKTTSNWSGIRVSVLIFILAISSLTAIAQTSIDISGYWKDSAGKTYFVEKNTDGYTYVPTNDIKNVNTLKKSTDSYSNVILNRYTASSNYEFIVTTELTINLVSLFNPNDKSSWQKISSSEVTNKVSSIPATTTTGTSITTTTETSVNKEDEINPFRQFKGCGGLIFGSSNSIFTTNFFFEDRMQNSDIGLGAFWDMGLGSIKTDYSSTSMTILSAGARASYHLPIKGVFDPYIGGKVFYNWTTMNTSFTDYHLDNIEAKTHGFNWDWHVGVILYLGRFGLNGEFEGRGKTALFGISYALFSN